MFTFFTKIDSFPCCMWPLYTFWSYNICNKFDSIAHIYWTLVWTFFLFFLKLPSCIRQGILRDRECKVWKPLKVHHPLTHRQPPCPRSSVTRQIASTQLPTSTMQQALWCLATTYRTESTSSPNSETNAYTPHTMLG